ncbi:hypothetical protein MTR67_006325, partial [Solanum verrucosum]
HGFQIDNQARTLMLWRRSKIRSRMINSYQDETWSTEKLVFDSDEEEQLHVGNMEDDLIKDGLPGQPKLNVKFNQYAGYVNVDEKNGRRLFYYFAESASGNASSKPLVLWLNGGPGCSSLGFGAMQELGPFGVKPDGKTLYSRTFSWNKVANVMFLESPAGVGFSYSNTSSDYAQSGDKRTAQDAYRFLVNWFKRFPHYKSRDFYIMGESYAGFYVPELADIIVKSNMLTNTNFNIQLKGIMIGNGIMNDVTDEKGQFDYLWSHALISDETHLGIQQHCKTQTETKTCEQFQSTAQTEFGNIDPYNIYGPICPLDYDDSSSSSTRRVFKKNGYDPCEQHYVSDYLNLPQVQKALHASLNNLPNPWQPCNALNWKDSPSSMFPIYNRLIASGLRILLFSGDVDAVVSVTSTRYGISAMNLTVIKPWHVWHDDTKEVAGYMVVYDGLAFATVRGAGHQVPQFQPREADVVREFLKARRANHLQSTPSINSGLEAAEKRRSAFVSQVGSKEDDKISALPGQPSGVSFDQYSGYVTVDADAGRALFYYFTESTQDPSTKPLVLWLNGGPGCSSFGAGAMMELGPFRVNKDGKTLWLNPFAWNNVANILFLESPAGVGFSYSNTSSDYTTGDEKTRQDSFTFLVNWMERFPEYKHRDFYITGESYAGHYVPQLAQLILSYKETEPNLVINLQGIATGNGIIDDETMNSGTYDFYWTHALISDEVHDGIVLNCNFLAETTSKACNEYIKQADSSQSNIYAYNTYSQLCNSSVYTSLPIDGFDPCSADYVDNYLNSAEVQKALNVKDTPYSWDSCNGFIFGSWQDSPHSVLTVFQELMQSGIRVWIYSGDIDHVLSVTTSTYAIDKIKTPVKTPWYPWFFQGEVGGYAVEYQNLTFVTVRGAGHFVPSYQPGRALTMFSSFINGTLPPHLH